MLFYQFFGLFTISDFAGILGDGRCCFPKDGIIDGKHDKFNFKVWISLGKLFLYQASFNTNGTSQGLYV